MRYHLLPTVLIFASLAACAGEQQTPKPSPQLTLAKEEVKAASPSNAIQVYISDGARQCEGAGKSKAQTAKKLSEAGVSVISSSCGNKTGVMVAMVCGSLTTQIHLHTINAADADKAEALGYHKASSLVNKARGTGFKASKCPGQ